ncbi:hypothetical protein [Mesorhizobium sp. M0091]|uniref:hypothetical protein n=1 Tax=Mesorhizobium sp. M0091 TaxID=2956875 RepID=UPI00333C08A8
MTDSDNSTTLPSVTTGRRDQPTSNAPDHFDDADPAILLLRGWSRAEHVSHVLCRLQQRLERGVLHDAGPEAMENKVAYSIACQAEVEAATAALKLQDQLPHTQARSLLGVVAKLEIIAGADRDIDDPTDFPWPHIASVLDDLKKIAGRLPLERPERSVVQGDCQRYQALAADKFGLKKQTADLHLGQLAAIGIKSE